MKKLKLLFLAFGIAFSATAILCVGSGNPLIYYPIDYGIGGFFRFAILILFLSFGLVYINLSVLKWLKGMIKLKANSSIYYITSTILILQIVTMTTGYLESLTTRGIQADIFYYYKCVSNSCLYILTGNFTAIVVAYLYGKEENKITTANKVYSA